MKIQHLSHDLRNRLERLQRQKMVRMIAENPPPFEPHLRRKMTKGLTLTYWMQYLGEFFSDISEALEVEAIVV
jgi:hypothetical protein